MKHEPIYYGEYLQLDKVLGAQTLKSKENGKEAHDETLFIIIHQTYELWFKQIIHELDSVYELFNTDRVKPNSLGTVNHRLNRIVEIQRVLNDQLSIIETMTPMDFMEFRDYLLPASGFQSIQFRMVEIKLGLRQKYRLGIDKEFFNSRLKEDDRNFLTKLEEQPTLLELIDGWLSRMPFGKTTDYNFWEEYLKEINIMLDADKAIIEENTTLSEKERRFEVANLEMTRANYDNLFDEKKYQQLLDDGIVRLSREAKLSAIFIRLFRDEPILQVPNRLLELLLDIDEMFTTWRYRHAIMAQRMLGTKIGTGGSSGHDYLKNSSDNNRIFTDLFNLATFLLPKNNLPKLPKELRKELGFIHEE
jgi:tryptophan 2,3-dioxygenase